jgi:hypothetical protein
MHKPNLSFSSLKEYCVNAKKKPDLSCEDQFMVSFKSASPITFMLSFTKKSGGFYGKTN